MFINHQTKNTQQDYYTPEYAIRPLLDIIPKNYIIWEPCNGQGHISKFFIKHGYKVISSDIKTGQDFLKYEPDEHYDIIITNTPFKNKDVYINRVIELNKPFLLLYPFNVFESPKRIQMFKEKKISLFLLNRRVNYINENSDKKSKSPFYSLWIGSLPCVEPNHVYYL